MISRSLGCFTSGSRECDLGRAAWFGIENCKNNRQCAS